MQENSGRDAKGLQASSSGAKSQLPRIYKDKRFEAIVLVVTLASIIIALLLYMTEIEVTKGQLSAIHIFDLFVVALLIVDFTARMQRTTESKLKFLAKNCYEIPAMLPLLAFTAIEDQVIIGATVRSLRLLRLFRLLRLLRLANLFRTAKYLKRSGIIYFAMISAASVIFGSIGIYAVEAGNEAGSIRNYEDAVWFALTSVTISGYGDVYPVTTEGRIIGGVLIFTGLIVFLVFLSTFGATLVGSRLKPKPKLGDESKSLIKEKIDELDKLDSEDVDALTEMIKGLHKGLRKNDESTNSNMKS